MIDTYRCTSCGADQDVASRADERPAYVDCKDSSCDGLAYRVISAPSVHFHGGGFSRSSAGGKTK